MSNQNFWNEIVDTLLKKGLTIATMESCTGGGIANVITNVSGASAVLCLTDAGMFMHEMGQEVYRCPA